MIKSLLGCSIFLYFTFIPQISTAVQPENKLAFFVGHSQWDKGSQELNLPAEWDYCSKIGEELIKLAPNYHLTAKLFFRGQGAYKDAVHQMHKEKNNWDRNAPIVSCHYNSTPITIDNTQIHASQLRALFVNGLAPRKGSLMGTLVLYKPTPESKKIAEQLLTNVEALMPRNDSNFNNVSGIIPISTEDRGAREILSSDKIPVMLLEIGYGDNQLDMTLMKSAGFQKSVAEAILLTFGNKVQP